MPLSTRKAGRLVLALCALAISSLLIAASAPPRRDFWTPGNPEQRAQAILGLMSDEEVLGQLFMMAYPGDAPPALLFDWITRRGLGGVKIFGWNAEDTDKLAAAISAIQKAALASGRGIPLLLATDQEGGWIRHVKGATSLTPGNMAIGASGRPYDAYWSAYYIGRELDALGINMNFAPAVDLATRPRSTIIGPRAFSSDPAQTAALGAAYFRGLEAAGIIATAKHFPGHGDTDLDSHGVLPVIDIDDKLLWERELLPFRVLAAEGVPAVMSGHLNFPRITKDGNPASLSKTFMTDILRRRIGFSGVAVTDDLLMSGAANGADLASACLQAISAGNDLLMASRIIGLDDAAWKALLSAYRGDPAFRARAREAASRILLLKLRYLRPKGESALVADPARLKDRLPDPEGRKFFAEQAYRAVTAFDPSSLPWKPTGQILLVGGLTDFFSSALVAYPGAQTFRYTIGAAAAKREEEGAAFAAAAAGSSSVLVCVQSEGGMRFVDMARALGKRVAVLVLFSPEPLVRCRPKDSAVAVYGNSRQCMDAGLAALSGRTAAEGRLPLILEP